MTATELLRDELALSPARLARMLRITVLVALVVSISMALRVPNAAVSGYMIFFLAQRDVGMTIRSAVGGIIGFTVGIALSLVFFSVAFAEPAVRLPLMVVLAFGGMYLSRATPAGPLGTILGFLTYYVLTLPEQAPSPELVVRALLWLWVVVAYPISLLVLADLAFGARPEQVYREGIAERLRAVTDFLSAEPARESGAKRRIERFVRLGANDLLPYVDRGGPPATAQVRATLLREVELLLILLLELPDEVRRSPAAQPVLWRAVVACDAVCDALSGRGDAAGVELELLPAERRGLDALTPSTRALVGTLVTCIQTMVLSARELSAPPPTVSSPTKPHAPTASTADAARFAAKVTMAAMTAYLIYGGLQWYGIHTATITCFFVAQDSVGATIHKLTLRILGALVGASLGMLTIIFVLPALESVGGLVVLVSLVTLLAAWVGTASERLSYAGWQIALAFFLTVLQGFAPTTKLSVGRDRIIGILLGNILMSVVFTTLWPVPAAPTQRRALSRAVEALADMLGCAPEALGRIEAELYAQLTAARRYLPLVRFERVRDQRDFLLTVVYGLFVPIHAIASKPVPASTSPTARAALSSATADLAAWLRTFAHSVASLGPRPAPPELDPALAELSRAATDEGEPAEARARLVDLVAWLDLARAQCHTLTEARPT